MILNDSIWPARSPCRLLVLPIVLVLACGCTITNGAVGFISQDTALTGEFDQDANPLVLAFNQICLTERTMPEEIAPIAVSLGWHLAGDDELSQAMLQPLKKTVLKMPGGGSRFDEEQSLYAHLSKDNIEILSLEKRYTSQKVLATQCELYGYHDFLKSCEAVGKLIMRAPDHNKAYPEHDAQFIQWNIIKNGKAAIVGCERAPRSPTMPFAGVKISLKTDLTTKVAVRTSRPASVADGR